jgi:hypothetical protein
MTVVAILVSTIDGHDCAPLVSEPDERPLTYADVDALADADVNVSNPRRFFFFFFFFWVGVKHSFVCFCLFGSRCD